MLDGRQIRNISDVAAYRSAEEGRVPLTLWKAEDIPHIPFLGHYVPAGYRVATFDDLPDDLDRSLFYGGLYDTDEVWVECGGWGSGSAAEAFLSTGHYWAIVESGEFQTYARLYVKDDYASAQGLPTEEEVTCDQCHTVHNDLEECDGPYCPECGDALDWDQEDGDLCRQCDTQDDWPDSGPDSYEEPLN